MRVFIARLLRRLADLLQRLADWLDPPRRRIATHEPVFIEDE